MLALQTLFLSTLEETLFFIGRFWLNQYAAMDPPEIVTCPGNNFLQWYGVSNMGNFFMSLHSFTIIMSCGATISTFYFLPRREGLIFKFQFDRNKWTQTYLMKTTLESQKP